MDEGSVIIYKMCSWSNLKLEGWSSDAAQQETGILPTQLRLIAGDTKVLVALKRRVADCSILHTRVAAHLGDIVWILSQSQLRAASKLVQSLMEAAVTSAQKAREKAERESLDGESLSPSPDLYRERMVLSDREGWRGSAQSLSPTPAQRKPVSQKPAGRRPRSPMESHKAHGGSTRKLSSKEKAYLDVLKEYQDGKRNLPGYEVIQDSFHLRTGKIHLQFCDDMSIGSEEVNVEGSLKMQLCDVLVDIYFEQQAGVGRHHWNKANDLILRNGAWSRKLVTKASKIQSMNLPSVSMSHLRERGIVVRCSHFSVDALRSGKADETVSVLPVVTSDKETFRIPEDIQNPAFQVDLTLYYYPTECGNKFLSELAFTCTLLKMGRYYSTIMCHYWDMLVK